MWFILATLLIDAIGVGIIFPIMPDLLARVGAGSVADSAFWGGVLMAAYAGMLFVFGPVVGGLSDAIGRRPVLITSMAVLALDYVIMALASSFWMLLAGRLLAGIAGANHITATAYLADISEPHKRAANFGLVGAVYGIGFVMGPTIGGLAAAWSLSAPFWLAAGFAGLNALVGLIALPESLAPDKRRALRLGAVNPLGSIMEVVRLPGLALPLGCLFVFEFAGMVYVTIWAYWLKELFDWPTALIGLTITLYGVGLAITQGGILRLLLPRLGEFRTLILGVVASIVAAVGFGLIRSEWMVFALLPMAMLSEMAPPTLTALMSNRMGEDVQGKLQGVIASLGSVAAIAAPLTMTWIFRLFAAPDARVYLPGAPFLFSAFLILAVLPFFLKLKRE
ncbi:MAG TPA: MFS transporter [Aliiroseovarius sp.]|nr:MFS transporter [Aliiroseovarius sp.]